MSRPLRVDVEGGWYHVTARGIERRAIYQEKRYYEHFLELLEEMSERYGVEVHAYCLMRNHYHLIIRTPHANASKAIQWLNVSYSAWYNAKLGRVGHVFQGRFGSVLIDNDGAWLLKASEYLHLNPIRTAGMGLGKKENRAEGRGYRKASADEIRGRLEKLRAFNWSSYKAYAGYESSPEWLHTEVILDRSGGKEKYRRQLHLHVSRGMDPEEFECLRGRVAIGAAAFVEQARKLVGKVTKEQPERGFARRLASFEKVVELVERGAVERWVDFGVRRGDVNRDLVMYLARQRSGMTLKEIGERAGGLEYKAVDKAIKRFQVRLQKDKVLRRLVEKCIKTLAIIET
jgi:REP element-mobilizing transposase RayT